MASSSERGARGRVARHLKRILATGAAGVALHAGPACAAERPPADPPPPPPEPPYAHPCDPLPPPMDCGDASDAEIRSALHAAAFFAKGLTRIVYEVSATAPHSGFAFQETELKGATLVEAGRGRPAVLTLILAPEKGARQVEVKVDVHCGGVIRSVTTRVKLGKERVEGKALEVEVVPGALRPAALPREGSRLPLEEKK